MLEIPQFVNSLTAEEIDRRLDAAYRKWDGRPMTLVELSGFTGIPETQIRSTVAVAFRKIRKAPSAAILEYAQGALDA